jgi:photosystem II stability/assembly factor-like uncharacterized protein
MQLVLYLKRVGTCLKVMKHLNRKITSSNVIRMLLLTLFVAGAGSAEAQSWKKIGTFDGYICLAKFLDANTGFVGLGISPGKSVSGPGPVELDKTTDGGKTWIKASIPSGYGGEIGDLIMVDSLHGWLAMTAYGGGSKALWSTSDAGLTWNETQLAGSGTSVKITPSAMIVTDIFSNGHISTDGGQTFRSGFLSSTNCVDFVDPLHGVISDYRGQNWLNSNDGGLTWQSSTMNVESWTVYSDSGTPNFYAAPEGPTDGQPRQLFIYHSTDYGVTWGQLASFPFISTGHLTGLRENYLFFQVQDENNTISGVTYNGFYYSTDQGVTWTSIGGPSAFNDTRFSVLNECSGITLYGFDDQSPGSVFEYNFGSGSNSPSELSLPKISQVIGSSCTPTKTTIPLNIIGCITGTATIDSLWLAGSSSFAILDSRSAPRALGDTDSITVQFSPSDNGKDTTQLNIRYNLGSGILDTSITIIGYVSSPLLSAPVSLHREVAVSYFGVNDTLLLGVDINASVNLDSLWPYIHDISGTYAFDSSVVIYSEYIPPSGWTLASLLNHGNSVDFGIHNQSSKSPSQPMDLGIAEFLPTYARLETSDVNLTNFIMDVGSQSITPCVTEDEDQHWSVKVLVTDDVAASDGAIQTDSLSIYPNPAGDEVFVQNPNASAVLITIYDAIGRAVVTGSVLPSSTASFNIQSLAQGVYFLRVSNEDGVQTGKRLVIMR